MPKKYKSRKTRKQKSRRVKTQKRRKMRGGVSEFVQVEAQFEVKFDPEKAFIEDTDVEKVGTFYDQIKTQIENANANANANENNRQVILSKLKELCSQIEYRHVRDNIFELFYYSHKILSILKSLGFKFAKAIE
jgi:hypothetical protein